MRPKMKPKPVKKAKPVRKKSTRSFRAELAEAYKGWEEGPLRERLAPREIQPQFRCYSGVLKEEAQK